MKLLKFDTTKLKRISEKNEVLRRLNLYFKPVKASILYSFFLNLKIDGYDYVKHITPESSFYRKIKQLKKIGVDFSETDSIIVDENCHVDFDLFQNDCEVM